MQHSRQLTPEPTSAELDELYTLLRAGRTNDAGVKQRAVAIIQDVPAEELYCFMQQLLHTTATSQGLYVQCSSGLSVTGTEDEAPDSPIRLAPAIDQLCSAGNNADKGVDICPEEDLQPLPDSPIQRSKRPASSSPLQQHQQQAPSGRCFLAESLDLNLGASYDLLSKASLADFSSAAAAARLSTSNLIRQSHMLRSTMLSPVAEGSFMSAAPGELQQHEALSEVSEGTLEYAAALHPRSSSSSTGLHHQEGYDLQEDPREWAPDAADQEFCPSTCSSPREPAPSAAGQAAAAVRRSVAESAHEWPSSQPLPFMLQEAELQDTPAHGVQHMPAPTQPVAAQDFTPPAPWATAAAADAMHTVQVAQPQQTDLSTSSAVRGPPAANSTTPSSTPQVPAKRGGGPTPLGIITAPIAGANALRRSIGRLWGGGKKANNSTSSNSKVPAAPAPGSSSHAQRSLACASAPMAAAYGSAGSSSSRPGSRLPGFKQAGSPALRQPLQGFAVTQQGSSPTKAAAAAVAASAASSSSRNPSSAIGSGRSGSSSTPQRPQGGSIGYRPPGSAGRGAAGTADKRGVASPMGRDAAAGSALSSGSRIPSQIPGAAGAGSGLSRAAVSSRQPTALPQQQRGGLNGHAMHYERPSSQASVTTYARSDGTGSHTSTGAMGGFSGTHRALAEKKTPVLKQPASRLQQRQQAQQRAVQAATATLAVAGAGGSSSRMAAGQQLGSHSSGIPGLAQQGQRGTVQGGYGLSRQQAALGGPELASGRAQQPRGPAQGGPYGQGGARGRDGGGGSGARSQLRRSRSCGSMAEMLNVAELRSMWKELEKQQAAARQQPGGRMGHTAASTASPVVQAHSSIGRGGSRQQQVAAQAGSFTQRPSHGTAVAAAGAEHGEEDPGLPVLSRCHSPSRYPSQDKGAGVGASQVLARMGNVLGQVDDLLADGAAAHMAACSGGGSTGSSSSNVGAVRQVAGTLPSAAAGAGAALTAGIGQSPSALVYKLVKGAGSGIAGAAATPAAAESRMGPGSRVMGLGMQQTLLTPPAKIAGVGGAVCSPRAGQQMPWVGGGGSCADIEASPNPVSSPDEGPAVSSSSSQVSHTTGGLPRWAACTAPPAVMAASASASSQELLTSQEGPELSRQLF